MIALPPGYRITAAAGLMTLWHDRPDGSARCVTVVTDRCPAALVSEIARRDAARRPRGANSRPPDGRPACPLRVAAKTLLSNTLTRETAIALARHSGLTLAQIGLAHGISRERVRQILARAAARGADVRPRCAVCRMPLSPSDIRFGLCRACRRRRARERACRRCGARFAIDHRAYAYCPACRTETRPCAWCGRPITRDRGRRQDAFRNRRWFCNRRCFGRWTGNTHGFPAQIRTPRARTCRRCGAEFTAAHPRSIVCPDCRARRRPPTPADSRTQRRRRAELDAAELRRHRAVPRPSPTRAAPSRVCS